jgi:hypothetical protein
MNEAHPDLGFTGIDRIELTAELAFMDSACGRSSEHGQAA